MSVGCVHLSSGLVLHGRTIGKELGDRQDSPSHALYGLPREQ